MTPVRAAICAPPVLVMLLVAVYGVDVPYWDTWDWLDRHYPAAYASAPPVLERYWTMFNDHRVFVPLLVDRVILWASGGDMLVRASLKIPISLATLWLTLRLARRTLADDAPPWLPFALACLAFPLTYWPLWIDPRQFSVHIVSLAAIGALTAASAPWPGGRRVVVSGACCAVASLSYAQGLLTWPFVGLVLLGHRPRPPVVALLAWGVFGLLLGLLQVSGMHPGAAHASGALAPDLPSMAAAALAVIGLPVAPALKTLAYLPTVVAGACAVVGLAWLGARIWRGGDAAFQPALPWMMLAGWGLATAGVIGWGRGGLPLGALHDPRFVHATANIWTAGLVLLAIASRDAATRGMATRWPGWLAPVIVGTLALSYAGASLRPLVAPGGLGGFTRTLASGRTCLQSLAAADDACLAQLHPSASRVREIASRLGPERLRVLREAPTQSGEPDAGQADALEQR